MTRVTIATNPSGSSDKPFRATTRGHEAVGRTPGAALDALADQLGEFESNTFVVVQNLRPDEFFTAAQQNRLSELLAKRRAALDCGREMDLSEKAELEALVETELDGAIKRAAATVKELRS